MCVLVWCKGGAGGYCVRTVQRRVCAYGVKEVRWREVYRCACMVQSRVCVWCKGGGATSTRCAVAGGGSAAARRRMRSR